MRNRNTGLALEWQEFGLLMCLGNVYEKQKHTEASPLQSLIKLQEYNFKAVYQPAFCDKSLSINSCGCVMLL